MACLVITAGPQASRHFHLTQRTVVGGRDPSREIQLTDPKVSRRHFQIRWSNDRHILYELKSANGVFVNGTRITGEYALCDGDCLTVGDTELTYCVDDQPDRTDSVLQQRRADRSLRENPTMLD